LSKWLGGVIEVRLKATKKQKTEILSKNEKIETKKEGRIT
jgi:hypothetical protein